MGPEWAGCYGDPRNRGQISPSKAHNGVQRPEKSRLISHRPGRDSRPDHANAALRCLAILGETTVPQAI